MEIDDRLFLPVLQPEVPGNPTVVLVDAAIALSPGIELAGRDAKPPDEPRGSDLGLWLQGKYRWSGSQQISQRSTRITQRLSYARLRDR